MTSIRLEEVVFTGASSYETTPLYINPVAIAAVRQYERKVSKIIESTTSETELFLIFSEIILRNSTRFVVVGDPSRVNKKIQEG